MDEERIKYAINNTEVVRPPQLNLVTLGTSNIHYYLVTEPAYSELVGPSKETVVREGKVIAERPRVVTPAYLLHLEGFSQYARRYLEMMRQEHGLHTPGLLYRYSNEAQGLSIVSEDIAQVIGKLQEKLDRENIPLATIIKGVDELWDVCLLKFIHELTAISLKSNIMEMGRRGLLDMDRRGVPREARQRIEELFSRVEGGQVEPAELKAELDRWELWDEYEDRFLALFRRRS